MSHSEMAEVVLLPSVHLLLHPSAKKSLRFACWVVGKYDKHIATTWWFLIVMNPMGSNRRIRKNTNKKQSPRFWALFRSRVLEHFLDVTNLELFSLNGQADHELNNLVLWKKNRISVRIYRA